ncbi:Rts3 [Kluyveromyces lactis]|nr:Rts3 [Kluyveromyces lactis]
MNMNRPQLSTEFSENKFLGLKKPDQRGMRPQDTIAVVTDSESEDDFRKKPFFRVPSPGKTAKRTKRGSQSSAYSTPPSPGSFHPPHHSGRRLSSEEIINQMEKEQDAMVMRLLKEIDLLREENVRLRRSLNQLSSNLHNSDVSMSLDPVSASRPNSSSSSSLSQLQLSSQQQSSSGLLGVGMGNITGTSSAANSRRPSSSSQLLDNLTPELQRKRNSVTKNEIDFMEGYSPTLRTGSTMLTPNLSTGIESLPRRASSIVCGSRRRRSSGRPMEESDTMSLSPSSVSKIPKRAGSPTTSITVAR